jgi:serine/threonine-protein kinase
MSDQQDRLAEALSDRYTLEREVGAGGMATVFLARDIKHDRAVALKVLRPELSSAMGTDRFPREIRLVASFNHPHILSLYDSGESDGFLYYVMPFVEGETLADRLKREHQLPITDTVRILGEVTDALAYAHERGVVHRDIKPANVLLSGRHAVVADFGVAKALSASAGDQLTTVGIAVGSTSTRSAAWPTRC